MWLYGVYFESKRKKTRALQVNWIVEWKGGKVWWFFKKQSNFISANIAMQELARNKWSYEIDHRIESIKALLVKLN